jgi:signal transduction histidine kinase
MAAVVAHEVRNPLAGIKGAMQVLMTRPTASDADLAVMRDVVLRIDALSELINDLMVFARPRALRVGEVSLRPLVEEAVTLVRRDPIAEGVEIVIEGAAAPIMADAEMVRATLLNLLLNAAQAMNGAGRITVTIESRGNTVLVIVRDTGPGIPGEIRGQVLEPFFTTKARGGGLGLPIAKRTAELHGGTLTLECPAEGGTVITLELPRQPEVTRTAAPGSGAAVQDRIFRSDTGPDRG